MVPHGDLATFAAGATSSSSTERRTRAPRRCQISSIESLRLRASVGCRCRDRLHAHDMLGERIVSFVVCAVSLRSRCAHLAEQTRALQAARCVGLVETSPHGNGKVEFRLRCSLGPSVPLSEMGERETVGSLSDHSLTTRVEPPDLAEISRRGFFAHAPAREDPLGATRGSSFAAAGDAHRTRHQCRRMWRGRSNAWYGWSYSTFAGAFDARSGVEQDIDGLRRK